MKLISYEWIVSDIASTTVLSKANQFWFQPHISCTDCNQSPKSWKNLTFPKILNYSFNNR